MACSSSPTGAKAVGELGNGTFDYRCSGDTDPVCLGGAPANDFPDCILVGGRFELGYTVEDLDELHGWGYEFVYVEPASPTYFSGVDAVTALRTGRAAFVAYADDNVIDLLHLSIVAVDGIALRHPSTGEVMDTLALEVGETASIEAYGTSSTCSQAGGAVTATLASADSTVASAGDVGGLQINGINEGTTTVTVRMGELSRELLVTVGPATSTLTPTTTDASETDATDTGVETSTGTDTDGTDTGTDTGTDSGSSETGTDTDGGTDTGTEGTSSETGA